MAAKKELTARAQTSIEPYIAYMQDGLALCHKFDKYMLEEDKVGDIVKEIANCVFNSWLRKNCFAVESVIDKCSRFEQAKSRHIVHQFDLLPNTMATSSYVLCKLCPH